MDHVISYPLVYSTFQSKCFFFLIYYYELLNLIFISIHRRINNPTHATTKISLLYKRATSQPHEHTKQPGFEDYVLTTTATEVPVLGKIFFFFISYCYIFHFSYFIYLFFFCSFGEIINLCFVKVLCYTIIFYAVHDHFNI